VDNIAHSLFGVALADAMMGGRATKAQRPLVAGAGLIAANLPDIDLAYSGITPLPVGYLLHHRGHTHTIVGVAVLAVVLALTYRWLPPVRAMRLADRLRLWLLITAALASHLAMDALNTYGVHPFYPADNNWYFGDAAFIFEPSLWVIPGVAVAWNGRSRTARLAAALPMFLLLVTTSSTGVVPLESVAALGFIGLSLAWLTRRLSPQARAGLAVTATMLLAGVMVAVSREAQAESRRVLQPQLRGRLVDVILTPNPSSPLCWGVIGVESIEASGEYVLWRGTLSLAPDLKAPTACASHRFAEVGEARVIGEGRLALRDEIHQRLGPLRDLAGRDCWARAWLRFGRAPVIADGQIFDLRFADVRTRSFTHMRLARGEEHRRCPSFVPAWEMPRKDLLTKPLG